MIANDTERLPITIQVTLAGEKNEDLAAFHSEARERYTRWLTVLVDRIREYGLTKGDIERGEERLAAIESRWVAEGMLESYKNDVARKAALITMRLADDRYCNLKEEIDRLRQRLVIDLEPQLEEAKYMRRLAETDLNWAVAALNALGGIVESAREHER